MAEKTRPHHAEQTYAPVACTLESVQTLTPSEKLFTIKMPAGKNLGHQPGQFVQVSILGMEEAPISICNSASRGSQDTFQLAVRRAGILTSALHAMKPGDTVGIRGPFGTNFPVDEIKGKDIVFIAGGIGLAPMRSVIQYCEDHSRDYGKMTILYSARSPGDMLYTDELKKWEQSGTFTCQSTVDGVPAGVNYPGKVGLITKLIPPLDLNPANTVIIIVGPPIMYKFVVLELLNKKITSRQIIVSLERYMRCGVGKCGHCVIEHKYCCIDGPVFWLSEIESIQGAF